MQDIQQYKNGVKDQISSWLDLLSNNLALDWLVVVVSQHESSPFAKPRVNIIEKIKNDFCSKSAQSQRREADFFSIEIFGDFFRVDVFS